MTTTRARIDFAPKYDREGLLTRYIATPVGDGRLIDRTYDSHARYCHRWDFTCRIEIEYAYNGAPNNIMFRLVTQGRERGGRRYREFRNLAEAMETAEKWAARRFAFEIDN